MINSKVVEFILNLLAPTLNFQIGDVKIPIIYHSLSSEYISEIVNDNTLLSQSDWDSFETSWDFKRHPFYAASERLRERIPNGSTVRRNASTPSKPTRKNSIAFLLTSTLQDELTPEVEDKDVTVRRAELGREIRSLISYAVGCMFGGIVLMLMAWPMPASEWDDSKYNLFQIKIMYFLLPMKNTLRMML